MVRIGTDYYWDGGLVSNTPLQHLLENAGSDNMLVFQVDLFSARGPLPRDMLEVMGRQKDIQYSSRTRLVTDYYMRQHAQKLMLKKLLAKLPEERLRRRGPRAQATKLADLPEITILQLIYQQMAYQGEAKDYEFSGTSMREHWEAGYDDTKRTLRHKDWLAMAPEDGGVIVHDVHRSMTDRLSAGPGHLALTRASFLNHRRAKMTTRDHQTKNDLPEQREEGGDRTCSTPASRTRSTSRC